MLGVLFAFGVRKLRLQKQGGRTEAEKKSENRDFAFAMEKTKPGIVLLLISYGLIAVRCIGFGAIPGGFNQDGAMAAVDAMALSEYGTDRFGTWLPAHFEAWGYGQMSVLLSYLMVPFLKLWGLNSITARLPILLASIGGAAALYGFVRDCFGKKAACIALVFTAVNPWHFMQSRWALDCNLFPHMFLIGLFFLNKGRKSSRYIYLSMVFFALCMYSYGVSFYMVPVFLLAACIVLLVHRYVTWKKVFIAAAVYFGVSWPIYGTMLINFMKRETVRLPFVTMPFFPGSVRSGDIVFFSEEPLRQLGDNFRALVNVVFLQKPAAIWNAIDDFGTIYKCTLPLVLAGLGYVIWKAVKGEERLKTSCRLLLAYYGASIFTGLCINHVNVNRINIIFYSHILFAAIAVVWLVQEWRGTAALFIGVYGLLSLLFFNRYFTVWADQIEDYFFKDFLEAAEYAGELECDYYYITPDVQYDGYWHVSEILTQYAQRIDAEYYQGITNEFRGAEISYGDRYRFYHPSGEEIRTDINVAYVVRQDRINNYDRNEFMIKQFGKYYVAAPYN